MYWHPLQGKNGYLFMICICILFASLLYYVLTLRGEFDR